MKATALVSTGGKAYSKQILEVLPDASTGSVGQVATVIAGGTVAFVDPFLKNGGTIAGNLNITGQYQINGLSALYDNGGIWGNLRVVGNMSGANNDGIYLGYNQSNAPVRLFDGGVSNCLNLSGGVVSSVGLNKWLFGNQSDDGTFAQFAGAVKIKSDLTVTGTNGTFSTANVQSNLYFLNLTRSSVALTTVGNAGFGLSSPLAPVHAFGGTAMTSGWNKTSILQATYPVQVFNSNSTKWAGIGYDNTTAMRFWVNATSEDVSGTGLNALTILNNGYVGFGISPSYLLDVNGIANVSQLRLRTVTYPIAQDLGGDNVYMNTRVIQNVGGVSDGMYIGYINNGYGANRIYDGGGSNYLRISSATFSSVGISKWLFGDQSDNGVFAQFSGLIHAKSGITIDGNFSYGISGTRTETATDAGVVSYAKSGFYDSYNGANFPTTGTWYHLINSQHNNSYAANNYAMQIAGGFFDQRIFYRKTNTSATQAWREFVTADMAGNANVSGQFSLGGGVFAQWDGTYQRIYKRNGFVAFSIANNATYYDNDYHIFRKPDGTEKFTVDTGNDRILTYTSKHLFGSQSDDGTANQFAGNIVAKSALRVNGFLNIHENLGMDNNFFQYWTQSGVYRRMIGLSSLNNFYLGDVDNAIAGGNNIYLANSAHVWYLNATQKMLFNSSGLLINNSLAIEGSFTSPTRTISGSSGTYTINSTDHVVIITTSPGSTFNIDAPTTANKGREIIIVNKSIATQTLGQNYVNISGSTTNQIPNNQSIRLKYNGSDIQQI